jgi:dihydrofolate reductase
VEAKMRKIIISEMVSLDGFFAGQNGEFDWPLADEEFERFALDQLNEMDTILFGRVTYEGMAAYWPTAVANPSGAMKNDSGVEFAVPTSPTEVHAQIASKMNTLPKLVFSKSLRKVEWNNSRIINKVDPKEISEMKQEAGKNMVVFGSADLVSSLRRFALIDEYRLFVNPILLGQGKPMFKNQSERQKLRLVGSKTFKSGVVGLFYRPTRSG